MNRSAYYERMKAMAREVRGRFGFTSSRVTRTDLRAIYKAEHIRIDLWPFKLRKLRGAYFSAGEDGGPTVLLAKGLPPDPMVFTMAHELKHHFADAGTALSFCDISNDMSYVEIGAEVFAAELIFPEADFRASAASCGLVVGQVTSRDVVRLKRETKTSLSYMAIVKRLEFLGFVAPNSFRSVQWKKLEEQVYGIPIYKRIRRQG